jgi:hypothetical protein
MNKIGRTIWIQRNQMDYRFHAVNGSMVFPKHHRRMVHSDYGINRIRQYLPAHWPGWP